MPFRRFLQRILDYRFVFVRKPVLEEIRRLAEQQQRRQEAVAADLLSMAVYHQHSLEFQLRCWNALTPREQDVVALSCLGYKNGQIAERLGISITTVNTHARKVRAKFGIHGKAELRQFFSALDFSSWEEDQELKAD
jgi:DNA-binding CsgD family transcriptional regulator